jgi:hypothetical protein
MTVMVEKWDFFELPLQYQASGSPFLDVTIDANFTCNGRMVQVEGFYDGAGIYRVRFMPDQEGQWLYSIKSNVPSLDGLHGEFFCTPPSTHNHGPVRVANTTHFAYEDGTPYIPVGTTCYVWNLQGDALEEQTLKTLDQSPFNKMRMCVFPKRYLFNMNEPPSYPFSGKVTQEWEPKLFQTYSNREPPQYWDFREFNPVYFQHLEKRILDLRERGIEADLIIFHPYDAGAWGFDRMPPEVNEHLLRYLVARLAAFRNLWWSFANEYDLMVDRKPEDWDHYMQLVQQIDPYDHLRSIHNCRSFYDHTQPWVTHCSIQHHNFDPVPTWLNQYQKPVVIDECGYEGNVHMVWGDLSPEEMVLRFWLGFVRGAYVGHGETYVNEEEVLWWSKGGELRGESVARIAFLRQIFEQAPGLTPIEITENESDNLIEAQTTVSASTSHKSIASEIIPEGMWNVVACGYNNNGYYLFYFGTHQPASRDFNLSDGKYQIDVIDTWNMTIQTVAEAATGMTRVQLPTRKYMAVRIQKIQAQN